MPLAHHVILETYVQLPCPLCKLPARSSVCATPSQQSAQFRIMFATRIAKLQTVDVKWAGKIRKLSQNCELLSERTEVRWPGARKGHCALLTVSGR